MRLALAAIGLLLLSACTTPMQTADTQTSNAKSKADLQRFVAPTDGAAYSASDPRYYLNGNFVGGGGMMPRRMH